MTAEEKSNTLAEMDRVAELLDKLGVEYERKAPAFILFENSVGQCMAFPSQTYDDKMVVVFESKVRCDTAEELLATCGVMGNED